MVNTEFRADRADHEVVVIGAGPGGIAAGVKLVKAGIDDFLILEKAAAVGGSWRDNTYPGVGVDIPAVAYQYSFARNPRWSRLFPKGAEVLRYHQDVARRFGLDSHIKFHTEVVREEWDERRRVWMLHTADGRITTARFVISAVGAFLEHRTDPGIPGLAEFTGKVQYPTNWDHRYDHVGKRVGVIGTGASSVQIVPALAPEAATVAVFQRTPVWCLPKPDLRLAPAAQLALGVPGVAAAVHGVMIGLVEAATRFLTSSPLRLARPALAQIDERSRKFYATYVKGVVDDPATASALVPNYGPIAKRPTFSNEFLQAFNRNNTSLVTTPIERFTARGIRTSDGVEHEFDMIVLAVGYHMFSDPESYRPGSIVGRDGFDLAEFYAEHHLQAYESVALPGLPNRWMVVGPYSWTGTGWHLLVEVAVDHIVRAIDAARRRGATVAEVRQEAHDRYQAKVIKRKQVVQYYYTDLNGHVKTYYVNSQGDNAYVRPSTVLEARWHSKHFPLGDYRFERAHRDERPSDTPQPTTRTQQKVS